jgi:hypothetical protein
MSGSLLSSPVASPDTGSPSQKRLAPPPERDAGFADEPGLAHASLRLLDKLEEKEYATCAEGVVRFESSPRYQFLDRSALVLTRDRAVVSSLGP